jgi:hypothetical protein
MVNYDILLDPESDARFYGPIRRLLSPRFGGPRFRSEADVAKARDLELDPRSNGQLQVDTLIDLVERGVRSASHELFKDREPQVMVAVTTADLRRAREAEEVLGRHHAGDHTRCPGGPDRSGPPGSAAGAAQCPGPDCGVAWIDGRTEPITATDALRMICGSGFTPLLFDETGQAIDVGKDQRYFTAKQRRALAKRDGGCMAPGCDRPPDETEAHHINPWRLGPENHRSETRDGILLCRRCHKLLHDFGARISRDGSRYWLHWPGKDPVLLHSKSGVRAGLRAASVAEAAAPSGPCRTPSVA